MATTEDVPDGPLVDRLSNRFFRDYCWDDLGELAQKFPNEKRSLNVSWRDLHQFDPDVGDDYLSAPDTLHEYLEEALIAADTPIDVSLAGAHVRVYDLPETHTFYPGEFSPSNHFGTYRAIRGEITKVSSVYSKAEEALFECQICGTPNRVTQSTSEFQEPHECEGCDRKGPFLLDFEKSEFVDMQKLRVKIPPELSDGTQQSIDAFVEDDLPGTVTIGDRVKVSGAIRLEQQGDNSSKKPHFEEYLEGRHIEIEQTDQQDLDISGEERAQIKELANGAEGDPLGVAAQSLAPKIYGYETEKKAIVLSMVSGGQVKYPTSDTDRSDLHVLLLGDPGTAKSKMIDRAQDLGWRTVGVSSSRATGPGLTVAAEQDDFGDQGWTLKAGAFVKANGGTICIDELDDMDPNVRAVMLDPMSKQKFSASLAGENVTFQTETSVIAAGNPKYGRFDPYEPVPEQFDFDSALLSRFDLVFTLQDMPDEEHDQKVVDHMLDSRDAAKRNALGKTVDEDDVEKIDPPVDKDLFPKWIAFARKQDTPPFESEEVKDQIKESFLGLRGLYDYNAGEPVPVTFRDLEGIVRVAEAVAKLELSETITERHATIAKEIVGRSMRDIGRNEDGEFDADVKETGTSKVQHERMKTLQSVMVELQSETDQNMVGEERVVDTLVDEHSFDRDQLYNDIRKLREERGVVIEPQTGYLRYIGDGR